MSIIFGKRGKTFATKLWLIGRRNKNLLANQSQLNWGNKLNWKYHIKQTKSNTEWIKSLDTSLQRARTVLVIENIRQWNIATYLKQFFLLNSTKRTNNKEKVLPIGNPDKLLGRNISWITLPFFTQHFCFSQRPSLGCHENNEILNQKKEIPIGLCKGQLLHCST